MGNLKDGKLEKLADKGNGHYAYIDGLQEAKKMGELKAGLEYADAYRSIMSTVGGIGLTAVMNPSQLSPRDQVQILHSCIDSLRP